MANRKEGFEQVEVGPDLYLFQSGFRLMSELKDAVGVDPARMYEAFAEGDTKPDWVHGILSCALKQINGKDVEPQEVKNICERMITLYGLGEAWVLAQHLLAIGMIGDIKKSQLQTMEERQHLLELFAPFRLLSLKDQLFLWGWLFLISGIAVWSNFKLGALLGW